MKLPEQGSLSLRSNAAILPRDDRHLRSEKCCQRQSLVWSSIAILEGCGQVTVEVEIDRASDVGEWIRHIVSYALGRCHCRASRFIQEWISPSRILCQHEPLLLPKQECIVSGAEASISLSKIAGDFPERVFSRAAHEQGNSDALGGATRIVSHKAIVHSLVAIDERRVMGGSSMPCQCTSL